MKTVLVANVLLVAFVFVFVIVTNVSPQRTYQRACDCEYMVNGKCAYTLLLPTGSTDGACPGAGAGAGAETIDYYLRNMTNRVNNLFEVAMNQSLLLSRLQDAVMALQQNSQPQQPQQPQQPMTNDSGWRDVAPLLALLNATLQSQGKDVDQLKTTTEMLARNLSSLTTLLQMQMAELSDLRSVVNKTNETLERRSDDGDAKISELSAALRSLREEGSCSRRAALFSGPDRLNSTSVKFSTVYDNDTNGYGAKQLAIDYTGKPGAWCPQERNQQEWVQFDFGRAVLVFGIATKGRYDVDQWIEKYSVQYVPNNSSNSSGNSSGSGASTNGDALNWVNFVDIDGSNKVFQGNTDRLTVQLNMLWRPTFTRYVRILPLPGPRGGNLCTRADVLGCVDEF